MSSEVIQANANANAHRFTDELLKLLSKACGFCNVQHRGCPCRTCFYDFMESLGLSDKRATDFWSVVLILRGDYTEEQIAGYEKEERESIPSQEN